MFHGYKQFENCLFSKIKSSLYPAQITVNIIVTTNNSKYSLKTKWTLREKCSNAEFFLARIFPHSD